MYPYAIHNILILHIVSGNSFLLCILLILLTARNGYLGLKIWATIFLIEVLRLLRW